MLWQGAAATVAVKDAPAIFVRNKVEISIDYVMRSPRMASRFENIFYTTDAAGRRKAPNVGSLFRWITDFLTADFQQRASFIAGFLLGIRIG